jgi:hypothetical protein
MNRIDNRIAECEGICVHNYEFMADLYGLRDAKNGNRDMLEKLGSLDDFRRYQRAYLEGLELMRIDAKERTDGSNQPRITADVCHEAHQSC